MLLKVMDRNLSVISGHLNFIPPEEAVLSAKTAQF